MLAFILAIAVGIASLFFFFSAFFAPKLHRKDDFLWSGVGLFYAATLWICAQRMTGGVLLGQIAATTLVLSFAWQTVKLRVALANPEKIAEQPNFSLLDWLAGGLSRKKAVPKSKGGIKPQPPSQPTTESVSSAEKVSETAIAKEGLAEAPAEMTEPVAQEVIQKIEIEPVAENIVAPPVEAIAENTPSTPAAPKAVKNPTPKPSKPAKTDKKSTQPKKPNFFSRLFAKKAPSSPPPKSVTITEALDAVELDHDWEEEGSKETSILPEVMVESVILELTETVIEETPVTEIEDDLDDLLEEPETPENNISEDLDELLEESNVAEVDTLSSDSDNEIAKEPITPTEVSSEVIEENIAVYDEVLEAVDLDFNSQETQLEPTVLEKPSSDLKDL
jgi:hypothetical protein